MNEAQWKIYLETLQKKIETQIPNDASLLRVIEFLRGLWIVLSILNKNSELSNAHVSNLEMRLDSIEQVLKDVLPKDDKRSYID